ncbi:hypothetical protein FGB62_9g412 [Gracilaria domingensis]|nr:hypothetical protein FGB62_9g412 [Gracilaria domingensis]
MYARAATSVTTQRRLVNTIALIATHTGGNAANAAALDERACAAVRCALTSGASHWKLGKRWQGAQICLPDTSDFAELMADFEKQTWGSVAPQLAVHEREKGERHDGSRQKGMELAIEGKSGDVRKDSVDLKPLVAHNVQMSSFKGRSPR